MKGLGTFSTSYQQAVFEASEGVFYPSRIVIHFNQESTPDSDLLAESLQRKFNISKPEAISRIEAYVSSLKEKIDRQSYCRLDGIGYIVRRNAGKMAMVATEWKKNKNLSLSPVRVG